MKSDKELKMNLDRGGYITTCLFVIRNNGARTKKIVTSNEEFMEMYFDYTSFSKAYISDIFSFRGIYIVFINVSEKDDTNMTTQLAEEFVKSLRIDQISLERMSDRIKYCVQEMRRMGYEPSWGD